MLDTPVSESHSITLQIGLVQDKFEKLVKTLYEVSDPAHTSYGK